MIDEPKAMRNWRERIEALLARAGALGASALSASAGFHPPVIAVATVDHVIAGLVAVDTVAVVDGSRVLVANNNLPSENGIWVTHAGAWTRPSDWSSGSARAAGEFIPVAPGGLTFPRFGSAWVLTNSLIAVDAPGSDPVIYPKVDKGPIVIGGGGSTALANLWVFDASATGLATDITVGAVGAANVESLAPGAGDGRGTGTAVIAGTAAHTVNIAIINF